jgi:hypothetical protein
VGAFAGVAAAALAVVALLAVGPWTCTRIFPRWMVVLLIVGALIAFVPLPSRTRSWPLRWP